LKENQNKLQMLDEENREILKKSESITKEKDYSNHELTKIRLEKQRSQNDLNKAKQ
jgi:hypothetical protein